MSPIPRLRDHAGPALLSYGFRPFFLLGAVQAAVALTLWLGAIQGAPLVRSGFSPLDWHIHEMLYGYLAAVAAGFLLTAVPNWTGRLPLQGAPLLVLVAVWLAGRLAVAFSGVIGWQAAMAADLAFLALFAAAVGREIVAGRNWRNLRVLGLIAALFAGNAVFHWEAAAGGADYGTRIGVAVAVMLIMVIGGRIVPSFTRNWLVRENPGRLPAAFGHLDAVALAAGGLALLAWIALPENPYTGAALIAAGLAQAVRLARWAGERTLADRLVLVLHVGYAFVPLGFLLLGAAAFGLLPRSAGLHAWTAGAVGVMTLAVMTRATLGHTGRALTADRTTEAIYALVVTGALLRVCASLHPALAIPLYGLAGAAWTGAFLLYLAGYGPMLARPSLGARAKPRV